MKAGRDHARAIKRKYTPQQVLDIIRESALAGDSRAVSAAKADVTVWHCKAIVTRLKAAGEVPDDRSSPVLARAEEVIRRIAAGDIVADISRDVGFDVRHLIWRARRGLSKRAIDRRIAEAAGPPRDPRDRSLRWRAKRRGETEHADTPAAC